MTYLREDPQHPERVTGHVESPEWTADDRALMLALADHEATCCPGCGELKQVAWNAHMEGEYDHSPQWVCHGCSTQRGHEVVYTSLTHELSSEQIDRFPTLVLGESTTPPSDPPPDH